MILDEIVLHNFGLYADRQSITLTPPSPDKPVVLIGGLNGGGKTTLLDALQLGLFGPHAKTSNRGTLAYQDYLARCIHRGSNAREAAIEIAFRHTVEGQEDSYRLHRSWKLNSRGCKEHFELLRNGKPESALAENWISQVEDLIPPNIAHLFLFDGEQIECYASQINSSALIGAAIQSLLGLDVVDQLEKDLQIYERRKRTEKKDDSARAEIDAAEAELHALRSRAESLKQDRASLRTHKIDRKQRTLGDIEDQYRKLGGELYDRRIEIEREKSRVEQGVQAGARDLRELAAGAMPLLLVRELLESADHRDRDEEEIRRARDVCATLKDRDKEVLRHLKASRADEAAIETLKSFLDKDRKTRQLRGKKKTALDLAADVRGDLHSLLKDGFEALSREAEKKLHRQKGAEDYAHHMRIQYESIPGPDAIAEISAERDALKDQIAGFETDYAVIGNEITRLEREIERRQQTLTRLLQADAKAEGERADRARVLYHSEKVRTTLSTFRQAVTRRHVRRIEQLVFESYQQLLRKASLVTRLSIDPERFALTLYGRDGGELSAERLSAGERQLLAIALLWGLAKASGRPLPTAIDTPLGRLDTGHRMHITQRYFPFASHQVLLLSTDEEITGAYLESLEPWIGRSYHLAYDDASGVTRVVPGYFEAREAA